MQCFLCPYILMESIRYYRDECKIVFNFVNEYMYVLYLKYVLASKLSKE